MQSKGKTAKQSDKEANCGWSKWENFNKQGIQELGYQIKCHASKDKGREKASSWTKRPRHRARKVGNYWGTYREANENKYGDDAEWLETEGDGVGEEF